MRQFVPMTDDLLYDTARLPGPLVPYQCGVPCWHQLQPGEVESVDRASPAARPRNEETVSALP
jgi:hypothetical protein